MGCYGSFTCNLPLPRPAVVAHSRQREPKTTIAAPGHPGPGDSGAPGRPRQPPHRHGRPRASLRRLPWAGRPGHQRGLLPAHRGQARGLPLPPAAELPRRPAPERCHGLPAAQHVRRLPAPDRRLLRPARPALPRAPDHRRRTRGAGARRAAGAPRRPPAQAAGLRQLPRRRHDRHRAGRAGPAGPAARLPAGPIRRLAQRRAPGPRARLHGRDRAPPEP